MIRIRILGLALVAVFAMSAVAVASASALPAFVLEAGHAFPIEVTSHNKTGVKPTLKTKNHTITCETSKDTAQITGATTVAKVKVTYTGCKEGGFACTSEGLKEGEIQTSSLSGAIGYVEGQKANKIVGLELKPEVGTVFASFKCLIAVKVEGCTIGEVKPINVFSHTGELIFAEEAGKQKWTKLEGKAACTLKVAGFNEAAWLVDTEEEAFFEKGVAVNVKLEA